MQSSPKSLGIAALVGLAIGLVVGFLPPHFNNNKLEAQNVSAAQQKNASQGELNIERNRLTLSHFAVQAGLTSAQAEANNYSVAGSSASALFSELRRYIDNGTDGQTKQQLSEVLAARDRTIAGLAQANPGTKTLLREIFFKLQSVSDAANRRS